MAKLKESTSAIRDQGAILRAYAAKSLHIRLTQSDLASLDKRDGRVARCEAAAKLMRAAVASGKG